VPQTPLVEVPTAIALYRIGADEAGNLCLVVFYDHNSTDVNTTFEYEYHECDWICSFFEKGEEKMAARQEVWRIKSLLVSSLELFALLCFFSI